MRREKDVLEVKYETILQDNGRYKQQIEHLRTTIEQSSLQYQEEQKKNTAKAQTEEQHKQLVEQLQQMNLLRESNAMLRDENQRNLNKLKAVETKVKELENLVQPLQGIYIYIYEDISIGCIEFSICFLCSFISFILLSNNIQYL